jgi:hypothetical protein
MRISRGALDWTLLLWAWLVVGLICFLMTVQVLLLIYGPKGTWHLPRIYRVTIKAFDTDAQSAYTTVTIEGEPGAAKPKGTPKAEEPKEDQDQAEEGKEGEDQAEEEDDAPTIALLKADHRGVPVGARLWVLDNYYRSPLRPPQFRLTPQRLMLEFPEPLLILALLLIVRIRRAQAKAVKDEEEAPRERQLVKDDFHARAERFAKPMDPDQ